ncbi:MAG TPA: UDP-N-acetylmuramate--L-alanine ligase, partial [Acidimicrobiaceae bacterium]|nr:UDP-N-acetylmuramate--L-alanine ligase [Acidimicrobiaceae bacterium]
MSDPAGLPAGLPDLSHPLSIHIVGAGGAGMNAIGVVLSEMGHQVSGSDLRESLGITRLRAMGARITIGHDADNVGTVDAVVHSTAVAADNVELERARAKAIPVWRRAEILRAVCDLRRTVAVAGTHGKTTTSSMLSLCLAASGMSPSFLVGGDLNEIGSGAVWDDDGDLFVVEADESDGTFVELGAPVVLVTNIEPDHLDFHGSVEALHAAFDDFVAG